MEAGEEDTMKILTWLGVAAAALILMSCGANVYNSETPGTYRGYDARDFNGEWQLVQNRSDYEDNYLNERDRFDSDWGSTYGTSDRSRYGAWFLNESAQARGLEQCDAAAQANQMQFRQSVRPQELTSEDSHQVNIPQQREGSGAREKETSPPKPANQRKGCGSSVRRPELHRVFAESWPRCMVHGRKCAQEQRRQKRPAAGGRAEERLSKWTGDDPWLALIRQPDELRQ